MPVQESTACACGYKLCQCLLKKVKRWNKRGKATKGLRKAIVVKHAELEFRFCLDYRRVNY